MFRSSILCLMLPRLRIDKWTYEPRSNFNHKKYLSNACTCILNSYLIKSENTKTYLLSCNHIKNPKTPLPYCISRILAQITLLYCYLFYCICYYILLTFNTLCLTSTRWSWGCKTSRLFCRLSDENEESFFDWEFGINPGFLPGENLLLLQHSALGVLTSGTLLNVINPPPMIRSLELLRACSARSARWSSPVRSSQGIAPRRRGDLAVVAMDAN
jgi:hypothetical protein